MKSVLAIVCSLLLVGTLFVPVPAPGASAARTACKICRCCDNGACCRADTSSEPRPVSPAPTFSTSSSQFLALVPRQVAWTLPQVGTDRTAFGCDTPSFASDLPAYARNCVRLL